MKSMQTHMFAMRVADRPLTSCPYGSCRKRGDLCPIICMGGNECWGVEA